MVRISVIAIVAFGFLATLHAGETPSKQAKKIDFARDIRPILANHCWACHGPDEQTRERGLRLDLREVAVAKLKSGKTAIVPGDAAASALVARIESKKD